MDTLPLPPAIPAATLILLRDRSGAAPEVLVVERSRAMAFAPGALVFPGGRIEPGDAALAGGCGEDGAARVAALRETWEETGVLTGAAAAPGAGGARGASFADALAAAGGAAALCALVPFARWCPAHALVRRFDTSFFVARASGDLPLPRADGTENARAFWTGAAEALSAAAAGGAPMIFPTRRTMERLALYRSVDEALADARARPIRTITPWTERRGGEDWLCIPDDLGFPVAAERLAGAARG